MNCSSISKSAHVLGALALLLCMAQGQPLPTSGALEAFIAELDARRPAGSHELYSLGSLPEPPEGWPDERLAPAILEQWAPDELLGFLLRRPESFAQRSAAVLSLLGGYAAGADPRTASRVFDYVGRLVVLEAALPEPPGVQTLTYQLLLDPPLLLRRPELRPRLLPCLGRFLAAAPASLRDAMLMVFEQSPVGASFEASELVQSEAGVLARPSSMAPERAWRPDPDAAAPILASVYSLPSHFFRAEDVRPFLESLVEAAAPGRALLVLADATLRRELLLSPMLASRLTFLDTYGRYYTPWPRDPFLFVGSGRARALLFRPPVDEARQDDNHIAHEIFRKLPEPMRLRFGIEGLAASPQSFHNGNLLPWHGRLFLPVHAVEQETLARQRRGELPEADPSTVDGALRYLANARLSAEALGRAWGQPVVFVHPFPPDIPLDVLIAGAGHDLDSYLTLLDAPDGRAEAVVSSLELGRALLERMTESDWSGLRSTLRLKSLPTESLRAGLLQAQSTEEARLLSRYLDAVAGRLLGELGLCERLPTLLIPVELLEDAQSVRGSSFLLNWTNVVPEHRDGVKLLELFSSGLASGDLQARELFERLGYTCRFLPALRQSLVLGGGYRCASNHLRAGSP